MNKPKPNPSPATEKHSPSTTQERPKANMPAGVVDDVYTHDSASSSHTHPHHNRSWHNPYSLLADHEQMMMEVPWNSYCNLHNQSFLDAGRRAQFDTIARKMRSKEDYFNRRWLNIDYYPDFATMVIMAEGAHASRFTSCLSGYDYSCCNRKLCPYCAYKAKLKAWCRFIHAFESGAFALLTYTISNSVPGDETGMEFIAGVWDAAWSLLHKLPEHSPLQGALAVEEMSVDSLHPRLMVYPHVHAVVKLSPNFDLDQFRTVWESSIRVRFPGCNVQGALDFSMINDLRSFMNCRGYLFKPVGILEPYAHALACLDQAKTCELNQNVRTFFDLLHLVADTDRDVGGLTARRYQVYYSGCMRTSSRAYVGAKNIWSNRGEVIDFMGIGAGSERKDVDVVTS